MSIRSGKNARELLREILASDSNMASYVQRYKANFPHISAQQRGEFREMLVQVLRIGVIQGSRGAIDRYKEHLRERRASAKQAASKDAQP